MDAARSPRLVGHFDGSCAPVNPGGIARYGFILRDSDGNVLACEGKEIGRGAGMTNNIAEAAGVIALLEHIRSNHPGPREVFVYGDSSIVIRKLNGMSKAPAKGLYVPYIVQAQAIAAEMRAASYRLYFHWVPREQNTEADALSNGGAR